MPPFCIYCSPEASQLFCFRNGSVKPPQLSGFLFFIILSDFFSSVSYPVCLSGCRHTGLPVSAVCRHKPWPLKCLHDWLFAVREDNIYLYTYICIFIHIYLHIYMCVTKDVTPCLSYTTAKAPFGSLRYFIFLLLLFLFCCELFVKKTFVLFALTYIYHRIKNPFNICLKKKTSPCDLWLSELLVDWLTFGINTLPLSVWNLGNPGIDCLLPEPTLAISLGCRKGL